MIQAAIVKWLFNQILKMIEKADDKRIAKSFDKRLKILEKDSHPKADWVCLSCGCTAKQLVKPKKRSKRKQKKEK
tara:strand:+ start:65 stop:289 length:225 start_codon:yes stop_codon:yes gene_type:complete